MNAFPVQLSEAAEYAAGRRARKGADAGRTFGKGWFCHGTDSSGSAVYLRDEHHNAAVFDPVSAAEACLEEGGFEARAAVCKIHLLLADLPALGRADNDRGA